MSHMTFYDNLWIHSISKVSSFFDKKKNKSTRENDFMVSIATGMAVVGLLNSKWGWNKEQSPESTFV